MPGPKPSVCVSAGERFGRLMALADAAGAYADVACRCDCGGEAVALARDLRKGDTKSCGCLRRRKNARVHAKPLRSPEKNSWDGMISRCGRRSSPAYEDYGGRGIHVCERWHTFENFLVDMGARPRGTTLDRIDNSRGYDCGHCADCIARGAGPNCRWATLAVQSRNRRDNVWIEVGDERMVASDWGRRLGASMGLVSSRIHDGWDPVEAATTPAGMRRPTTPEPR